MTDWEPPEGIKEYRRRKSMEHYHRYIDENRAKQREYRKEGSRGGFLRAKRDFGVETIEEYNKLMAIEECEICGDSEARLVIDHDHKTGKARGRICWHCNIGLGKFRDDPELIEFALNYLKGINEPTNK